MINNYKIVGWDVDTQRDFMENSEGPIKYVGKLAIKDAMNIEQKLDDLTIYLRQREIPIMGSLDWHNENCVEFSRNPNFVTTFPRHCIAQHYGSEKISVTKPLNPIYVNWQEEITYNQMLSKIKHHTGEVFFRKDRFDVFDKNGNPYSKKIVSDLKIEKALVYGVALEVCNDFAIKGLQKLGVQVYAVSDAMKAIDEKTRTNVLTKWREIGVHIVRLEDVLKGEII